MVSVVDNYRGTSSNGMVHLLIGGGRFLPGKTGVRAPAAPRGFTVPRFADGGGPFFFPAAAFALGTGSGRFACAGCVRVRACA